jgi:DNA-binding NtrC family response regulator
MDRTLAGCVILVVEDEPIIALDVVSGLQDAGATVVAVRTLEDALRMAQMPELTAAVLDHRLSEGDTSAICEKLKERHIPFVLYSGVSSIHGACSQGELVRKPAPAKKLVATLVQQLSGNSLN